MTSPTDAEIATKIAQIQSEQPDIGALKILAAIKASQPDWALSEKRLRKILQSRKPESSSLIACTGLDPTIDIRLIAPKVKVELFAKGKGKGLVAESRMQKGEVIWQEEPWIATADQQLHSLLVSKSMCTACLAFFPQPNPSLSKSCPSCHSAHFCNRLCLARSKQTGAHHDLLCPGVNPGCVDLLKYIHDHSARHLDATARIIALWRKGGKEIEGRVWDGMARVNQLEKEKERREWPIVAETRVKELEHTHRLVVQALNPPRESAFYASFQRALGSYKGDLSVEDSERWFSFDSFLQLLGLAGINQEASGGLYALHAHLNHSCEPNVQVRNLPRSFKAPDTLPCDLPPPSPAGVRGTNRLTILARRDIEVGEELCIPYVNFALPREQRREDLRLQYGFWCNCGRCQREA